MTGEILSYNHNPGLPYKLGAVIVSPRPGHGLRRGGSDLEGLPKRNTTMVFIVTLAQTHPHTPGWSVQWNTPTVSDHKSDLAANRPQQHSYCETCHHFFFLPLQPYWTVGKEKRM